MLYSLLKIKLMKIISAFIEFNNSHEPLHSIVFEYKS
ncbi:MAG: hypothetical protein ACI83W_002268 [Marinoscillum sp.]|jgi:hypothetical protein